MGDSRCYRVRKGHLKQLTRDSSLVNDYRIAIPHLTDEQMAGLPRNVITRALGMQDSVVVDITTDSPRAGDIYVLCSDGLSEAIEQDFMAEVVKSGHDDLDGATGRLIDRANDNGGDDNITVILVAVDAGEGDEEPDSREEPVARRLGADDEPTRDMSVESTAEFDEVSGEKPRD